jgi:hypothetical protein
MVEVGVADNGTSIIACTGEYPAFREGCHAPMMNPSSSLSSL